MRCPFISKPPSGKRGEPPYITGLPAIWMRGPRFSVLRDGVTQSLFALVGFPDDVKRRVGAMREPQYRLVVAGGAVAVFRPTVFVVPDNLPSIVKADLIHVGLQETRVVMNRVDKQIPCRLQDAAGLNDPTLAPFEPFISAVKERAYAEFRSFSRL